MSNAYNVWRPGADRSNEAFASRSVTGCSTRNTSTEILRHQSLANTSAGCRANTGRHTPGARST
jgi:hypothetical protein